jgi:hypothetical protein
MKIKMVVEIDRYDIISYNYPSKTQYFSMLRFLLPASYKSVCILFYAFLIFRICKLYIYNLL